MATSLKVTLVESWDDFHHTPGQALWSQYAPAADGKPHPSHCEWDDCDGWHLFVCLPTGVMVDLTRRASNCDQKTDRTHRCWVVHQKDDVLHVDKNGRTCGAGAGSILVGEWHGFLHNGHLVTG